MAITIRNVMDLPSLKDFRLAAGQKGLENPVEKTGIVDYEFTEGFSIDVENAFERNSLVISSLLFAKDDPSRLLGAVRSLIDYKVSALAIKTVFFRELPREVKELADREGFVVFFFDSAYFEDVIADLRQVIQSDQLLGYGVERLQRLFGETLAPSEVRRIASELHPALRKWVRVYSCEARREMSQWELSRIISRFALNRARKQETAAFCFDGGLLFFVSQDNEDKARFRNQFADALHYAELGEKELVIGESGIHEAEQGLDKAVKEAIYARRGARLIEGDFLSAQQAGMLLLLLWQQKDRARQDYAEQYLAPIRQGEKKEGADLYPTAAAFVRWGGRIPETAKALFIHENTVRYRIGKIRERLDPEVTEAVFFQNLSAAVWITAAQEAGYL